MRKFTTLCVAFAFAAAATGAHAALKLVGQATDDPASGTSSVTYAKETLLKTATIEAGGITYYEITQNHFVSARTGVYSVDAQDAYVVSITLEGLVFAGVPTLTAPDNTGVTFVPILGGIRGAENVVFQRTAGNVVRTTALNPLLVMQATFAISDEGSGTIRRVVQNRALANLGIAAWTETDLLSNGVRGAACARGDDQAGRG